MMNYSYGGGYLSAWKAYSRKCETSFIARNGIAACGLTYKMAFDDLYRKPEVVAEHEGRTAFLYGLIMEWVYYKYCNDPDYHHFFFSDQHDRAAMLFLLSHDIGEIVNGDQLDDGSNDHEESRVAEDAIMNEFYGYFPPTNQYLFLTWRQYFEDYSGSDRIQFMKAIDKVEAVSFQLFLATKGITGDVMRKDPPSERDLRFAQIIRTTRSIDVWAFHYRVATKHYHPKLLRLTNEFLGTAFLEVYGYLPNCMTTDVTNVELDE